MVSPERRAAQSLESQESTSGLRRPNPVIKIASLMPIIDESAAENRQARRRTQPVEEDRAYPVDDLSLSANLPRNLASFGLITAWQYGWLRFWR